MIDKNMTYYTSIRIIDGKPRKVIVDKNGNVRNKNPTNEELRNLEKEPRKAQDTRKHKIYTDEELLDYLNLFYEETGMLPTQTIFNNSPAYPTCKTYQDRFGSWSDSLKLAGLDLDTMVKKGIIETTNQRSRLSELIVKNHFEKSPTDLSGENCNSHCDGICPNGKIYDVKSSVLIEHKGSPYWIFTTKNKYNEEIEIYYFLAFNSDWTKLDYVWRVPGEIVDGHAFYVGNSYAKFTIKNMKDYDITKKFKDIVKELTINKLLNRTK